MKATNENSSRGRGGENLNSRLQLPSIRPSQDQVNSTPRKRVAISPDPSTFVDYDEIFDVADYFVEHFLSFRPSEDRSLNKNLKWRSSFPSDLKNSLGDLLPVVTDSIPLRGFDRRAITDNTVACCCLYYALPKLWADDGICRIKEAHGQIRRGRSTSRDEGLVEIVYSCCEFSVP